MSNTSLKKIQIPALNHANFGKAITEQFANIDANFQKLANFELGAGVPGKSCLYVTINLMAPFVYPTSDIIKRSNNYDVNLWMMWAKQIETIIVPALGVKNWNDMVAAVDKDYEQFARLTNCDKYTYANIAAKMLWGSPATFVSSHPDPAPESLTGALHAKYKDVEGKLTCKDANGNNNTYYGNWLWEIFKTPIKDFSDTARAQLFIDHMLISKPGRIIVAISPSESGLEYYPVGSLEYWYIDPRYRNGATDREDTGFADISCVMHWTPEGSNGTDEWKGHFEILEIFPTIRRGEDGVYYWFINGMNTGVPVQGPAGKDGPNAQLIVVQRIENVVGYHPEKYPNGRIAIAPFGGEDITVPLSAFAGDSLRNLPSRTQYAMDMPTMIPQLKTGNWPKNIIKDEVNAYNRLTSVKIDMSRADYADYAWLDKNIYEGYALSEPYNLFRIYRLVGRELLWKSTRESKYDTTTKDPLNHYRDPSCDEYYFDEEDCGQISVPDDSSSTQQLIDLLDGSAAIVLPGPAYQFDRTDSTYWFTTLRKVEWRKPGSQPGEHSGVYMLMAYCSDEERFHNAVDEHTQAGMMQRLDVFAYKSNGDNRNKPRGLMLPIGSAFASYADGAFEDAWAAHIIHSDCGGFTSFERDANDDRRGHQFADPDSNMVDVFALDAWTEATGRAKELREMQYREVIGKKVLHVGSVMDYRALNYVSNNANDPNGGVPGRVKLNTEQNGMIGSADFYGGRDTRGWFEGSELHVDEPVTITRYRDLHKRQRLLDVEGDVVIGPRNHKNGPQNIYRNRDGGLVVHSTVSPDTGKDDSIFPDEYDNAISIFNREWFEGLTLTHRSFHRELKQHNDPTLDNIWKTTFGRWRYDADTLRAIYKVDTETISTDINEPARDLRTRFSILADDSIGARALVAQDGIVVYNPEGIKDGNAVRDAFSVDAMGNIQTMGEEVRSNADNTLWVFHSRWTVPQNAKYADIYTIPAGTTDPNLQSWLDITGRDWVNDDLLNEAITAPGHNDLMIGCDHEFQYIPSTVDNKPWHLARYWRASNWHDWDPEREEGLEHNTDLCMIPAGWLVNIGSMRGSDGRHGRTFGMVDEQTREFGYAWGSNELLPTVGVYSFDNNHFYGAINAVGPNVMAVRSAALGAGYAKTYLSGRYNIHSKYGLIVGPARDILAGEYNHELTFEQFEGKDLKMQYTEKSLRESGSEKGTDNTDIEGLGDRYGFEDCMFENVINTPIAIWGRGSIFTSDSLIADNDLAVNRLATIRGQIRAKSFRRHTNSLNKGSNWAFMLDDGISSRVAPRHHNKRGTVFSRTEQSPIMWDLGAAYGPARIIKFGTVYEATASADGQTVNLKLTDDLTNEEAGKHDSNSDRQIALFGMLPDQSRMYHNKTGRLFTGAGNKNAFIVNAQCNNLWAQVAIQVNLDAYFTSRDRNKKGLFGGGRYSHAYGIGGDELSGTGEKITRDGHSDPEIVCSGFNWNELFGSEAGGEGFPKPKYNVDIWIGSAYSGRDDANWYVKGTNSARDKQYGALFRLDPSGRLVIPIYNHPEAMTPVAGKTVTLTFTYPTGAPGFMSKFKVGYTNEINNGEPYGEFKVSGAIYESLDDVPEDFSTVSESRQFIWIKQYNGYANPSPNDWDECPWTLWKSFIDSEVKYYLSKGIQESGDGDTTTEKPAGEQKELTAVDTSNGGTDNSDTIDPNLFQEEDYLQSKVSDIDDPATGQGWPYLWAYTKSTTFGETVETWELLAKYEDGASSDSGSRKYSKTLNMRFYYNNFKKNSTDDEQVWGRSFDDVSVDVNIAVTPDIICVNMNVPLVRDGSKHDGAWLYFPGLPHAWNDSWEDRRAWEQVGSVPVFRNLLQKRSKSQPANPGIDTIYSNGIDSNNPGPHNFKELFEKVTDGKETWSAPSAPVSLFIPSLKSGGGEIAGGDSEQQYGIWFVLADDDIGSLGVITSRRPVMGNGFDANKVRIPKLPLQFMWFKEAGKQPVKYKTRTFYKLSLTEPSASDMGTELADGGSLPTVSASNPKLWVRYQNSEAGPENWFLYAEWSESTGGDPGDDSAKNLAIFPHTTCDEANTRLWLNTADLAVAKSFIVGACDTGNEVGSTRATTVPFGYISYEVISAGKARISMIVTAYKSSAADLSHRSINFICDSSLSILDDFSTYIIGEGNVTNLQNQINDMQSTIANLQASLTALQNKIVELSVTPDIITVNVPAGQSSVDVTITEKDAEGTEVNPVDPLTIKTESGLTHNG